MVLAHKLIQPFTSWFDRSLLLNDEFSVAFYMAISKPGTSQYELNLI